MTDREGEPDDSGRLTDHPLRATVLAEMHARPFQLFVAPRAILHYAFMLQAGSEPPQAAFAAECRRLGVEPPAPSARFHVVPVGSGTLRFEAHSEFVTCTFDCAGVGPGAPLPDDNPFGTGFVQPGPVMVATRLDLVVADPAEDGGFTGFDRRSLAVSSFVGGAALAASDFAVERSGATRIVVIDHGLGDRLAGPTVQRLIEVETYRTLALLGLPEAQRIAPEIQRTEAALAAITARIRTSSGIEANRALLDDLTALAGDLESTGTVSSYRFAASRAYAEIVKARLRTLAEESVGGYGSWSSFLDRRMAPALRTCEAIWKRQQDLTDRLARTAELLRTRVEIEVEQQNGALLQSMNRRARMQLRLQQTVEGLSVAAVSYYVVGLIGYLAGGISLFGVHVDKGWIAAASVLPVVALVWWMVRGVQNHFAGDDET